MSKVDFVGREQEKAQLERMLHAKSARLVVIKGRRRVGKSRLIQEFIANHKYYHFSGLAPTEDTTASNSRLTALLSIVCSGLISIGQKIAQSPEWKARTAGQILVQA